MPPGSLNGYGTGLSPESIRRSVHKSTLRARRPATPSVSARASAVSGPAAGRI